nr:acyl-CoA dehydrogenase family protein [Rhodococcus wratislaviensis]GLK34582.1 acyl-CoA dehydrogenase [Rhodococcus wratislaviensis]
MGFTVTAEQQALREVMQSFTTKHSSEVQVRELMATTEPFDPVAWSALSEQIGAPALVIPEKFGGAGFGFGELGIVLEESGRSLLAAPLLSSSVLATYTLLLSEDDVLCAELLPGLAEGARLGTLAAGDDNLVIAPTGRTTARHSDDGWRVTGAKAYVLDAMCADFVIVAADTESGHSLFVVDLPQTEVDITPLTVMDQTRSFARVDLGEAPARPLGRAGAAGEILERVADVASVALACEQVGAAAEVLERTVEYLKVRNQFGRPIGSFQALKHRCADMLVELESARSAATYATTAVEENSPDLPQAAAIAKTYCSEAFYHIAAESIQMHGGIGFTWEHHAHLYFKRAKASELLFGSPAHHRARLETLIGLVPHTTAKG